MVRTKYLTKESSEEKMLFRPIDFYGILDDLKAINSFLESISKVIVTGGGRPEHNEEAADVLFSSLCSEWQPEGQN